MHYTGVGGRIGTARFVIFIAQASITRGQGAWTQLQAAAKQQRALWLEVGTALLHGKQKENRPQGMKFFERVNETFPGLR